IPSGSPVIVHADGTAEVIAPDGTVPAYVEGDQLGLTMSDRLPDVLDDEFILNAATLMHGRIRYRFLGTEAKAAIDAAVTPEEGAVAAPTSSSSTVSDRQRLLKKRSKPKWLSILST